MRNLMRRRLKKETFGEIIEKIYLDGLSEGGLMELSHCKVSERSVRRNSLEAVSKKIGCRMKWYFIRSN